jgi:uncharacterized membrane protein SpoIIM required for sporulation
MNVERLLEDRRPVWRELDGLLQSARRPERLGPDGVRRLGRLYREVSADLAQARAGDADALLVAGLESLSARAHAAVYESGRSRQSLLSFVTGGYWRRVRSRPSFLLTAVLLTAVPATLGAWWGLIDPGGAAALVPGAFRSVTAPRPHGAHLGLSGSTSAAFASVIFTHNIQVAFAAFAGGVLVCVPTVLVLVTNGVILGVLAALAAGAGNGAVFTQLVVPHGVLELSCIAVAGAAGLRLGWAVVDPGWGRRGERVVAEARKAVELVLGTLPWLVVAGLVEGYITPSGLGVPAALVVGLGLGAFYWSLVLIRGRGTSA